MSAALEAMITRLGYESSTEPYGVSRGLHLTSGNPDMLVVSADLTREHVNRFARDGFLIIAEGFISPRAVEILRDRFQRVFDGEYKTGVKPDEVNWVRGRDPEDRTRQICNGWKADETIAAQVLSERTGRMISQLMGWRGARILQDNVLWKPPGTKSIGMHQDGSYAGYLVPPVMATCWIALDDTQAGAGTLEYVRGSHLWPKAPPVRSQFHAPDDWLEGLRRSVPRGEAIDVVPVVVKAGGCSFHHSLTWHGSASNTSASVVRRALVSHIVAVEARFHPTDVSFIQSR